MERTPTSTATYYRKEKKMPTETAQTMPIILEVVPPKYTYGDGVPVAGFKIETTHYCNLRTDKRWTFSNGIFTPVPPKKMWR
jgi:hypothetical protein